MAENAFEAGQGVPARLIAGNFWTWRADGFLATYPPHLYNLTYIITPRAGGAPIECPAIGSSDGWLVEVNSDVTSVFGAGAYVWSLVVERLSDQARVNVCSGQIGISGNPALGADTRTQAKRLLDAVNATLEGRAVKDVDSYSIEGRALTRVPFEVLRATRARLMREVRAEQSTGRRGQGGITYHKPGI